MSLLHIPNTYSAQTKARARIESEIAARAIDALLAAGFHLGLSNGEDDLQLFPKSGRDEILDAMWKTDEEHLLVFRPGEASAFGWVFFVYGNDGWDVINDRTTNLDEWLVPVEEWIAEKWE